MFGVSKKGVSFLAVLLLLISVFTTGCLSSVSEETDVLTEASIQEVQLINPLGPVVIPIVGITSNNVKQGLNLKVQFWKTADEALGLLCDDEIEFAVLPVTMAANMKASGIDLVLLGVHEWKVFYLIAREDAAFDGFASLMGKTVYTPTAKGQTVDVLTRYALSREGINSDGEVDFAYAPPQEIAVLFQEGKIDYAALPEPFVTLALKNGNGDVVLDYQEYWSDISGSKNGIPIAGLFVKRNFMEHNPYTVKMVAQALSESTSWANNNIDAAIEASSEILPLPQPVMKKAMERISFEYVSAADISGEVITFLQTMQDTYPGGIKQIPDEEFFAK